MKTTCLIFIGLTLVLTACEITVVEPRYDARDKVVGSYQLEEYSQTYRSYTRYSVYIRKSGFGYGANEVAIENFYGTGIDVYATVVADRLTIPLQIVNGYEVEGAGTIYFDELRLTYRVRDTYTRSSPDYCEARAWW
ncbi:MAG: hypothetical protein KF775_01295 [Cyclobacteriaceae bacterium]|nr:hypothetical protein [Cytophagales bacterium]MBX2898250.1 hypothetical protein [Cyclobacteriaceae bacterium]